MSPAGGRAIPIAADFHSRPMLGEVLFPLKSVLFCREISLFTRQEKLFFLQIEALPCERASERHFRGLLVGGLRQLISGYGQLSRGTVQQESHISHDGCDNQGANGSQRLNDLAIVLRPCSD
jgi:hypothetical protein